MTATKRILFICGSMNQTTQMHQISRHLTEYEQAFSPYLLRRLHELMRRLRLMEFTIIGDKLASRCRRYLEDQDLAIDYQGSAAYDLVVTCSDVYLQKNIRGSRIVLVQEGITDPETVASVLCSGTACCRSGLRARRDRPQRRLPRFCVASDGYRDLFIRKGAKPEKIVVTGIPNFDDCQRYRDNTFPHRITCWSARRRCGRSSAARTARRSSGAVAIAAAAR